MLQRKDSPLPPLLSRAWVWVWASHALAAFGWWWMKPPGYPVSHPHFWSNRVAPPLVLTIALLGLWACWSGRPRLQAALAAYVPMAWITATLLALLVFPLSWFRLTLLMLPPTSILIWLTLWLWQWRTVPVLASTMMLLPALLTSLLMIVPQRALDPDTHPLAISMTERMAANGAAPKVFNLRGEVSILPEQARVDLSCSGLHLKVHPLLTFRRRSPDRCWVNFAPTRDQEGSPRHLTGWLQSGKDTLRLDYQDEDNDVETLRVHSSTQPGTVALEAYTQLAKPVYSHLNSYCTLKLLGDTPLSVAFSPCPDVRIAVRPWGDFKGGLLRFAYRDAMDGFHVVEADSNDKGPFHELASGKLTRHDPLRITVYEGERAACHLTLEDWSAQVADGLSPCAGYGLPANAIEFSRYLAEPTGSCTLSLSLAATAVGRGRDSVGHGAGIYRNRMRIQGCDEGTRISSP